MRYRLLHKLPAWIAVAATAALLTACPSIPPSRGELLLQFGEEGRMSYPLGYRTWPQIGVAWVSSETNPGSEDVGFRVVFIDPVSLAAWEPGQPFPTGTVLVREHRDSEWRMTSDGSTVFPAGVRRLEVAVKDPARFADQPGGWGYFVFEDVDDLAVLEPATACSQCHAREAAHDHVFTQYYVLPREARDDG